MRIVSRAGRALVRDVPSPDGAAGGSMPCSTVRGSMPLLALPLG